MAKVPVTSYAKLIATIRDMESAHDAIRDGVATHAQKHEAELLARRKKLENDAAIESGIARGTQQV